MGKTTVLTKAVHTLRERGFSVGGMLSRELSEGGIRLGFEILDLGSHKSGWLAHVSQKTGPQVGKYRVNLQDLEAIGSKAILVAIENCDIVAIDEIGPMELFSEKFKAAALKALESSRLVIAVVHWKAPDRLIRDAKNRADAEVFAVTVENRERLCEEISDRILRPQKDP